MTKKHWTVAGIVAALAAAGVVGFTTLQPQPQTTPNPTPTEQTSTPQPAPTTGNIVCDDSLWQHVYTGDPRKFSKPQDRLQVITPCVSVTGVIVNAKAEADGDFHIRLQLDPQYQSMLNAKNTSGQHGYLVLEPVCSNPVSQNDTLKEGVCNGFSQHVFDQSMVGKHVEVIGAYVTDMEHGWNEIHPVTSITVQ